jgi:AraC-like DNA-binding protein
MTVAIAAMAACLSTFLLVILATKWRRHRRDAWLAVWLIAQSLFSGSIALSPAVPQQLALPVLMLGQSMVFLLGPSQYLYAAAALGERPLYLVHSAVLGLATLMLAVALMAGAEATAGAIAIDGARDWLLVIPVAGPLLAAFYPASVVRLIQAKRGVLKEQYADLSRIGFHWLSIWAWTSILFLVGMSTAAATSAFLGWSAGLQVNLGLSLLVAHIAYVGVSGITKPGIFVVPVPFQDLRPSAAPVDRAEAAKDYACVEKVLREQKAYLQEDLTAGHLAETLGWAPERLTRSLRHGGGTKFFDAINAARVREVQELAADPRNDRVSILALAHDAGFGSKTAFYNAFQRHVGCSPAAWRRTVAAEKQSF